jgi:hypothetical protein
MANDSGLFFDHTDVAPRIVERRGALAVLDDASEVYPLLRREDAVGQRATSQAASSLSPLMVTREPERVCG